MDLTKLQKAIAHLIESGFKKTTKVYYNSKTGIVLVCENDEAMYKVFVKDGKVNLEKSYKKSLEF